jgi:hypothetical protein
MAATAQYSRFITVALRRSPLRKKQQLSSFGPGKEGALQGAGPFAFFPQSKMPLCD